ncbi:MAG TPA: GGDEF domain-containing protein, partial [Solirubrobacteraceae bacterium]|nr:GGDEF domain-containing protein [Solirubrobacteraceae bacterium]
EDGRSTDPVERLLEDSWEGRERTASRSELVAESGAALLFLAVAVPLAVPALSGHVSVAVAALTVVLYAVVARAVRFPIGAGHVVPSYLVLVPMLLLLPARAVPVLAATGLVLGSLVRLATRRAKAQELVFSVADAWHTLGPAIVLWQAGSQHGLAAAGIFAAAFIAAAVLDLAASSIREALALGIAPHVQGRVIAVVWLIDASVASLGLLAGLAARRHPAELLMLLPVCGLLIAADRDRTGRIAQAQHRLDLLTRERTRLQSAIGRLGQALAAKLDLRSLGEVVLEGSIDALDADAGRLIVRAPGAGKVSQVSGPLELQGLLAAAIDAAERTALLQRLESADVMALAVPFSVGPTGGGVLAVARAGREFREDEERLVRGLVERAQSAVGEIVAHAALREEALSDALTGLGNRRKLADDLTARLAATAHQAPAVLMLFDLNGFKRYNDTFGHLAGDALLVRLAARLRAVVSPHGSAYRLGGDEFCALIGDDGHGGEGLVAAALASLTEDSGSFAVSAACGTVRLPDEAATTDHALQLADERMYAHKRQRTVIDGPWRAATAG